MSVSWKVKLSCDNFQCKAEDEGIMRLSSKKEFELEKIPEDWVVCELPQYKGSNDTDENITYFLEVRCPKHVKKVLNISIKKL